MHGSPSVGFADTFPAERGREKEDRQFAGFASDLSPLFAAGRALGKPMRAAIGGGQAVIPSNVKLAAPGATLDLPLGHKDDVWSFDHFDTLTVSMPDGPRADEIVVVIALADGGRPHPRCGSGPVR